MIALYKSPVCENCTHIVLWSMIVSSRVPLTFRQRTCILWMDLTKEKEWIVADGVGEKEGGIARGSAFIAECYLGQKQEECSVSLLRFIPAQAWKWAWYHQNKHLVTEMLCVSCLDTPYTCTPQFCAWAIMLTSFMDWYGIYELTPRPYVWEQYFYCCFSLLDVYDIWMNLHVSVVISHKSFSKLCWC